MAPLTVFTFVSANTFEIETVKYGIKSIIYHVQRCLAVLYSDSHPKYLVLIQHNIIADMLRQLNLSNNQKSVVMYLRNRVLYILQPVLNQAVMHTVVWIIFKVRIIQGMYGIMNGTNLTDS